MRSHVYGAVSLGVCPDARDRLLGDIDRDHLVTLRRQRQREPAVVAERVEQASRVRSAPRPPDSRADRETVQSSVPVRIDQVRDAPFAYLDLVRHGPVQHVDTLLEPFEQTNARIVASEDPGWPNEVSKQLRQLGNQAIDAL